MTPAKRRAWAKFMAGQMLGQLEWIYTQFKDTRSRVAVRTAIRAIETLRGKL